MDVTLVGPEFEENLSLRYLAAAVAAAGHSASMARFDSAEYTEGVVQHVLREKPGIVGFSMVFQVRAREFFELARALRGAGYSGHITAGGHFATFAYTEILAEVAEIDTIIRQEGEAALCELAAALDRGAADAELQTIPGIVIRDNNGHAVAAAPRVQTANLDLLPFPVRDDSLERHLGISTAFLVGSRGCYADCEYCSIFAWHEAAVGKRYRLRTVANIVEEMHQLYTSKGARFFVFHDDNFFLPSAQANRKRFTALRDALSERGMTDIGLMLKLRPNDCDRENMEILKEIGLMRAFVGIENASQRQLRSLGRDSTIGDVEACLAMLRELDIYATFNILLFDPYTQLEDIAQNIRFLRRNGYFPFNWCKVEPYAGTELEKRYGREGRLIGSYLGYDYRMDDVQVRLLYDLLLPAVYYRNFDYYGLANLNIGMGYHRQLLKRFYPHQATERINTGVQRVIEEINTSALDLIEMALDFVSTGDLLDNAAVATFAAGLKRRSFADQHRLSARVETVMREIEQAAGVRIHPGSGVSEAFTPLIPSPQPVSESNEATYVQPERAWPIRTWMAAQLALSREALSAEPDSPTDLPRRRTLQTAGGALIWLLAGCRNTNHTASTHTNTPPAAGGAPQASLGVAPGHSDTVAAWETMRLEALLQPDDAVVVGEPRVTASGGTVERVEKSQGGRALRLDYRPGGGYTARDPNVTVTVTWTVRGKHTDTTVMARSFVHVREDGSYVFGYQTPRPTISEMAAPPISQGPKPPPGG